MASGIGETLRTARRQQGVSLADAAAETRVRETYLAALEEEDFAALGGDVYVKGFLRSYARFLRLDPEPLLATYRTQFERPSDEPPLTPTSMSSVPRERRPTVVVGIGIGVLVLALLAVIGILGGGGGPGEDPDVTLAPEPAQTSEAVPPLSGPVSEGPVATEPANQPFDDLRVRFEVRDSPAWMRVTVDGTIERQEEQPPGTRETYRPADSIVLRVGDASAVDITVNGSSLGELGEPGQVVEVTCEVGATTCDVVPIT